MCRADGIRAASLSDAWGDIVPALPTSGRGFSLNGFGDLLKPLGQLFKQPDPLDAVRLRLALLELAKATSGGVLSYADVGTFDRLLIQDRQDWVLLGSRGAGKTAAAIWIAQILANALHLKPYVYRWPSWAAEAVGISVIDSLDKLRDCIVVVDESGLKLPIGKRDDVLLDLVSLARHNNVSVIWTSQSASGVHRDILRQDVRVAWGRVDPVQVRFDRQELADLLAQVVSIQGSRIWSPGLFCVPTGAGWSVAQAGIPQGWNESVSRLWRR